MIDFHMHTIFSDGVLVPSELVRRCNARGYRAMGITDHVDGSNIDLVLPCIIKVAGELNRLQSTFVIPGVEITHAPPAQIAELTEHARHLGAWLVIVHGESPVEPVAEGTNRAGIEARADILAHPGFISVEDARLAARNGVHLEITARSGHSLTNGHVARIAREAGAALVLDTDTHTPDNLITKEFALNVCMGAGLPEQEAREVLATNERLMNMIRNGRNRRGD